MRKVIEQIVYGKRNKLAIYGRKLEYKVFSLLRNFHPVDLAYKQHYIVLYPVCNNISLLNDALNRIIWSYPTNSSVKVYYSSDIDFDFADIPFQHSYIKEYINNHGSNLIKVNKRDLIRLIPNAKAVLLWDKTSRYKFVFSDDGKKFRIIDPWYYSLEESNNMKFGLYNLLTQNQKSEFYEQTEQNYDAFRKENSNKICSYIFVTGPSFATYDKINYEKNSLKIVCNTIIKDKDFLEYIGGPDIICFCDPAFHFSTNDYAYTFRTLVLDCIRKYGSYIAIPQACVPLISYNYPEIRNKIIGLRRAESFTIPTKQNMSVKPTGSVLTFMMLPIALSLTKKVGIIGADGRGENENYFWKHNDKVQLTNLMESVYETHPSFFRDRDYADHYTHHCEEVRQIIEMGEKDGVQIVAKTKSFVPCLKERYEGNE